MRLQTLDSVDDVIDRIGGTGAAAKLTQRTPQAVSNWRAARRFPTSTIFTIRNQLKRLGFSAPASLWGLSEDAA